MILFMFFASMALAQGSTIGYIEVQKIFKEYKETVKAQGELDKKQKEFQDEFEKSQKQLADAQKAGKSDKELDKMKTDLEKKLEPKRAELLQLNQQLATKLQSKIVDASQKVAKKLGLEIVVDKQVIIVGGMDVTDMVLQELNR